MSVLCSGRGRSSVKAAFSLFELFTVIAIIAVLTCILMTVMGRVKANAKSVYCAVHMRQILLGIAAYSQDNQGFLVSYQIDNRYWFDNLSPFLDANTAADKLNTKSRSAFYRCPEWNWTGIPHFSDVGYGMCHTNNVGSPNTFWSSWNWVSTGMVRDGRIAELTYPSTRIMLGESAGLYIQVVGNFWAYWTTYYYDQSKWQGLPPAAANPVRHSGRANYGFVDGHVQSLDPLISPLGYADPKRLML